MDVPDALVWTAPLVLGLFAWQLFSFPAGMLAMLLSSGLVWSSSSTSRDSWDLCLRTRIDGSGESRATPRRTGQLPPHQYCTRERTE